VSSGIRPQRSTTAVWTARASWPTFSNTGAKITKVVPATIPDEFMLSITPRGRKRACRVRWRYGEAVGVEFTDRGEGVEELSFGNVREPAD
jgi:hypothetical protein